ncbi:exported hypothetical protein [Bacillus pumilus]
MAFPCFLSTTKIAAAVPVLTPRLATIKEPFLTTKDAIVTANNNSENEPRFFVFIIKFPPN